LPSVSLPQAFWADPQEDRIYPACRGAVVAPRQTDLCGKLRSPRV